MKPAVFDYHAPETVAEALELLAELGDEAKVLAGGQSLVPAMNFRLAQPTVLIDLNRAARHDENLTSIRPTAEGGLRIGAMTRQRAVERSTKVTRLCPLVAEAMPSIAHPQIRNRGTFGGSIAHADPAAELPALVLALGGRLVARSRRGERSIDVDDFFTGLFETALEPDEILAEVALPPLPPDTGTAFLEVSRRQGDFALVGVAAVVTVDTSGLCRDARLTFLSVGDGPVLARRAIDSLAGETLSEPLLRSAAATAAQLDIDPPGDLHASAAFRRHLTEVLSRRALERAWKRALGSEP